MTNTGVEIKIAFIILKSITALVIVWFFEPIYDFIIMNTPMNHLLFLTPWMKDFIGDMKLILGLLVAILVLYKTALGISKMKKGK